VREKLTYLYLPYLMWIGRETTPFTINSIKRIAEIYMRDNPNSSEVRVYFQKSGRIDIEPWMTDIRAWSRARTHSFATTEVLEDILAWIPPNTGQRHKKRTEYRDL
jgi:hypothetical protein